MRETILSVGIDIGTSTTSVVFSEMEIANLASEFHVPDIQVINKKIVYRSPIYFTPLRSNSELNIDEIVKIVEREYKAAGVNAADIETGAVIVTGDTARKNNAKLVVEKISDLAGDFVAATVGPEYESLLAGRGSGAEQYSIDHVGIITNCDIGGGTSNSATFYDGKAINATYLDIGGRLIRFKDNSLTVDYVFPGIAKLAETLGICVKEGDVLSPAEIHTITDEMARVLLDDLVKDTTEKAISFSGGVGKLIYEKELPDPFEYNDIGVCLADSIRNRLSQYPVMTVVEPEETIGATVIGSSNYAMEVSGSTILVSRREVLPVKNLPIANIENPQKLSQEELITQIRQRVMWKQNGDRGENVAVALTFEERIPYRQVCQMAEGIVQAMKNLMEDAQVPLIILLKADYGRVLGQTIKALLPAGREVLCIDGVNIGNGDYLDIGAPLRNGQAVPIVIKTLAFSY